MCQVCDLRTSCLLTLGQFDPAADQEMMSELIALEIYYEPASEIHLFGYPMEIMQQIAAQADGIVEEMKEKRDSIV